ncbi:MAG TPA: CorA family divalent cation transporter [Lachnospiraceae bacterium]|nr:CorA family divalent cation transporter [Lachnospiraceae bacterium]
MIKILYIDQIQELESDIRPNILDYIRQRQMGNFETFENFSVMAFDWYDVAQRQRETHQVFIYCSVKDLFFLCEDAVMEHKVQKTMEEERGEAGENTSLLLYRFFARLLKNDQLYLDRVETEITDTEDEMLTGSRKEYIKKIIEYRKELLSLKSYYEQLDSIFDELSANDNSLLEADGIRRFHILSNRTDRCINEVQNLREYVSQMREAYQSTVDIQQNELMKLFTVITTIFLPLTLLVGWYGMNFPMPEFQWNYGYPALIVVSIIIVAILLYIFKKKKWL